MKNRLVGLTATAAVVSGLALAPVAQAKVVRGKYNCYTYSVGVTTTFLGAFNLRARGKYNSLSPGKGKGKYAVKGKNIKFKTGPYKGFSGKVTKSSAGLPELMLHVVDSGRPVLVNCFHG